MTHASASTLQAVLRRDLPAFVERVFATLEPGTALKPNWSYEHLSWALSRVIGAICAG